jgi:hypothetical protein
MIYRKLGVIFIHIPKTGGTSFEAVLASLDGGGFERQDHRSLWSIDPRIPIPSVFGRPGRTTQYLRETIALRFRNRTEPGKLSVDEYCAYRKVAIVRNPFSRAVSWYNNVMSDERHQISLGVSSTMGFKEFFHRFAGKGMLKSQMFWLGDKRRSVGVDEVLRFEAYSSESRSFFKSIGSDLAMPHYLKGQSGDYRELFGDAEKALALRVYREEIERFGYEF